jgi:hypothetical protein
MRWAPRDHGKAKGACHGMRWHKIHVAFLLEVLRKTQHVGKTGDQFPSSVGEFRDRGVGKGNDGIAVNASARMCFLRPNINVTATKALQSSPPAYPTGHWSSPQFDFSPDD